MLACVRCPFLTRAANIIILFCSSCNTCRNPIHYVEKTALYRGRVMENRRSRVCFKSNFVRSTNLSKLFSPEGNRRLDLIGMNKICWEVQNSFLQEVLSIFLIILFYFFIRVNMAVC